MKRFSFTVFAMTFIPLAYADYSICMVGYGRNVVNGKFMETAKARCTNEIDSFSLAFDVEGSNFELNYGKNRIMTIKKLTENGYDFSRCLDNTCTNEIWQKFTL